MTIRSVFRISTAACAVALVIALVVPALSSDLTMPAAIITALAGVAPLIVFILGTTVRGATWDEEVDAVRLIDEIMSREVDHSAPVSLTERPGSANLFSWTGAGAGELELRPSR